MQVNANVFLPTPHAISAAQPVTAPLLKVLVNKALVNESFVIESKALFTSHIFFQPSEKALPL